LESEINFIYYLKAHAGDWVKLEMFQVALCNMDLNFIRAIVSLAINVVNFICLAVIKCLALALVEIKAITITLAAAIIKEQAIPITKKAIIN
jgi:hypothetical protein